MKDSSGKKRHKVLVTAPRAAEVLPRYEQELGATDCEMIVRIPMERLTEEELLPLVGDVDGIICGDDRLTARVLEAAPRLKVISKWGTGIDSIDTASAKSRGIVVCNSPGAFSDPVADSVLGYILLFARRLDQMNNDMSMGSWRRLPLRALNECTLGIVGLGDIGCAVARRAAAFGMKLMGCTNERSPRANVNALGVLLVPLETILSESDFVTLHADLRDDNRHLVNAENLKLMRSGSVLINTARGGLIDENALVNALRQGTVGGAALDVFEEEPLPQDSPLRGFPNVYLSPHNANASAAAAERVHVRTIRNLVEVLDGRKES